MTRPVPVSPVSLRLRAPNLVTRPLPVSPVSLRLGAPDMVTRSLPVSPVSLRLGAPDMVTRPLHVQRVPSWPGWLTGRCPGTAWLRQAQGPSRPCCAVVHVYQAGRPELCGSRGHSAGPTTSEYLSTFSLDEAMDVPGLKQSPGTSGLPGELLLDHRGDSAPSSALSPGWLVHCPCHQYHS